MHVDLGAVDLREHSRAKLLTAAIEKADADGCSCVVRHAEILFIPASVRVRERLSRETDERKVLRIR